MPCNGCGGKKASSRPTTSANKNVLTAKMESASSHSGPCVCTELDLFKERLRCHLYEQFDDAVIPEDFLEMLVGLIKDEDFKKLMVENKIPLIGDLKVSDYEWFLDYGGVLETLAAETARKLSNWRN